MNSTKTAEHSTINNVIERVGERHEWLNLQWLSEYRNLLMGFAILIIVPYHFTERGGSTILIANNELTEWDYWEHLAFVYRIPDFLTGCMAATAINHGYDKRVVLRFVLIFGTLGIMFLIFKIGKEYYLWFTNLGLTPFYLLVLCWFFNKLKKFYLGKIILSAIGFTGLITLELYRISIF